MTQPSTTNPYLHIRSKYITSLWNFLYHGDKGVSSTEPVTAGERHHTPKSLKLFIRIASHTFIKVSEDPTLEVDQLVNVIFLEWASNRSIRSKSQAYIVPREQNNDLVWIWKWKDHVFPLHIKAHILVLCWTQQTTPNSWKLMLHDED